MNNRQVILRDREIGFGKTLKRIWILQLTKKVIAALSCCQNKHHAHLFMSKGHGNVKKATAGRITTGIFFLL